MADRVRLGPGAEAIFLRSLIAGEVERIELVDADRMRVAELVETYTDLALGTVDASVMAGRLGVTTVATLDLGHLSVVRPRRVDAIELVP